MDLKFIDLCYNLIEIFVSLVSILNFNFNRQYSSPNCHSECIKLVRAIVLDSSLILSDLSDFGESIRFIGTSNRLIGTLFGPRNRAGSCASFAKSYRRYSVQMNHPPKQ